MADLITDNELKAFGDGLNSGAKFAKWFQSILKNKQNPSNILEETEELSKEIEANKTNKSNILDEAKTIDNEAQQASEELGKTENNQNNAEIKQEKEEQKEDNTRQEEVESSEKLETTQQDNSNYSSFKDNFLTEKENLQNEIEVSENNKDKSNTMIQENTQTTTSKSSLFQDLEIVPKEEFAEKFLKYSKTMSGDEIKVLSAILNKNPSKLTKEDKKLIVQGLQIAVLDNDNFKHLNPALHCLIKSNAGMKSGTKEINSFLSFDMSKANNPMDKVLLKHTFAASIDKIKNTNNSTLGVNENKTLDSLKANFQGIQKNASAGIMRSK